LFPAITASTLPELFAKAKAVGFRANIPWDVGQRLFPQLEVLGISVLLSMEQSTRSALHKTSGAMPSVMEVFGGADPGSGGSSMFHKSTHRPMFSSDSVRVLPAREDSLHSPLQKSVSLPIRWKKQIVKGADPDLLRLVSILQLPTATSQNDMTKIESATVRSVRHAAPLRRLLSHAVGVGCLRRFA